MERFGKAFEGTGQKVGIRVNPGVGSGGFSASTTAFSKTNVGGPSSAFDSNNPAWGVAGFDAGQLHVCKSCDRVRKHNPNTRCGGCVERQQCSRINIVAGLDLTEMGDF